MIDRHDRDPIGRRYATSAGAALCLRALHAAVQERFLNRLGALTLAGLALARH